MSIILGISGGFIHRVLNPAASLIINGKLVFAQEEERLNRVKNSRGLMPTNAIREALIYKKLNIRDVDFIAFNSKYLKLKKQLNSYFNFNFGYCPKIYMVDHHTCHAYSAYFPSKFKESNIITIDYSGNGISTTLSYGKDNKIKLIKEIKKPNSLGIFYSLITQLLGYEIDNDEYKVMGLASYGKPYFDFDKILKINKHGYFLNKKIINKTELNPKKSLNLTTEEPFYSNELLKYFNLKKRFSKKSKSQKKINLAASAQNQLNKAIVKLAELIYEKTGSHNFCLAGGVALNCTANGYLSNLDFVQKMYIQPAASDAGGSLGAALYIANKLKNKISLNENFYLGNSFNNKKIKETLKNNGILNLTKKFDHTFIARQLSKSKVIGFFNGRHEFGPRALGNRSILANPKNKLMKKILNKKIKFREDFRPFAPIVLKEHADKYFELKKGIDYSSMTITCAAKKLTQKKLPSCVHFDKTSRVQVLDYKKNPKLGKILKEFGRITGEPVLINTSFNLNGRPNVNTPDQAISTFYSSGMDYLVLGDYVLSKK